MRMVVVWSPSAQDIYLAFADDEARPPFNMDAVTAASDPLSIAWRNMLFLRVLELTTATPSLLKHFESSPTFGQQWRGNAFALREQWYEANGGRLPWTT